MSAACTALQVEVGSSFVLTTAAPTTTFLRVRPSDHSTLHERLCVRSEEEGATSTSTMTDSVPGVDDARQFVDVVRLPAGRSLVSYSARVEVQTLADPMPGDAFAPRPEDLTPREWWWLQPSRYCRPDELGEEAWGRFGGALHARGRADGDLVRSIRTYVNESMTFEYGSSSPLTSATDAWAARRGVCRDFNHVAVSFCRALNIPARYAFGYLPDIGVLANDLPMDFCAWFEVLLDGAWWTFDARVNEPRIGRVVVGRGRDAADVPLVSTLGAATLSDFGVRAVQRSTRLDDRVAG